MTDKTARLRSHVDHEKGKKENKMTEKFTTQTFKQHIEMQRKTKGELAEELYGSFTYDIALPEGWVDQAVAWGGRNRGYILANFVWLYQKGDFLGQPAPLTVEACDVLEKVNSRFKLGVTKGE